MTTCPSGVHYMHLVDHARAYIERTYRRPPLERALRWAAGAGPALSRAASALALRRGAGSGGRSPGCCRAQLRAMLALAPARLPPPSRLDAPQVFPAEGARRKRVALLAGCAQRVLDPEINAATIRLLTRHGCEVVIAEGAGCCGALTHHMGKAAESHAAAAANIRAWMREAERRRARRHRRQHLGLRHHGQGLRLHVRRTTPLAADAATVAGLARDVTRADGRARARGRPRAPPLRVAYHAACSLQHGQQVRDPAEGAAARRRASRWSSRATATSAAARPGPTTCCSRRSRASSARARWRRSRRRRPQVIAAGNIGCMMQIGAATAVPVVHTVELLDWATGGPRPPRARRGLRLLALAAAAPAASRGGGRRRRRRSGGSSAPRRRAAYPRGRAAQHRRDAASAPRR